MSYLPLIARLLLGVLFFVFGLNGFLHFLPMPPLSGQVATFMTGLAATGYFFPFLMGVQVISGLLLLSGAFVPLALVMLAPIVINIVLFHIFLDQKGLSMATVMGVLELYLAFFVKPYDAVIKQIFRCPKKDAPISKDGK